MVATANTRIADVYGHPRDIESTYGNGFTVATSGTARGTVVPSNVASPTMTVNITEPFGAGDSQGLIQITTSGTQAVGNLLLVNFQTPYAYVPVQGGVSVSTTAGAAAGGVITATLTNASLLISVGTALVTGTVYTVRYTIDG